MAFNKVERGKTAKENYDIINNNFDDTLDKTTYQAKIDGIEAGAQKNTVTGVKGNSETAYRTGNINITKANIGLGNVDNTSDANKPISTAAQTEFNKKLNKGGDTLNDGATLKFSTYGNRFLTISGNSISVDMSQATGGWAGAFASVKDPTETTTTMLGWYGGISGLTHIYMGGAYNDPYMKMTPSGQFTFKYAPKVGSTTLALLTDLDTRAKKENSLFSVDSSTSTTAGTWLATNPDITELFDGLAIKYKVAVEGASTTKLNLNGFGAKTVYLRGTTKVTSSHYGVGTMVILVYNADTDAWYSADYDANSYAYVRQYTTTTNNEYPLLFAYETTLPDSYDTKYTRKNASITANPSTGVVSATSFKENGVLLEEKYLGLNDKSSSSSVADKVKNNLAIWATTNKSSGQPTYSYNGENLIELDTIYSALSDGSGNIITATYATKEALKSAQDDINTVKTDYVTSNELSTAIDTAVQGLLGTGVEEAYNTFKEIQDLMKADDTQTANIITQLNTNTTNIATLTSDKLDKIQYEWSKALACGSNGKVCIGKFGAYDTNITINLSSTTSKTYNATIVIRSQNIFANSTGGGCTVDVYGDANNQITPLLSIFRPYGSANRQIEVYANLEGYSKNVVHIKAVALSTGGGTDILTSVDAIPTTIDGKTKVTPTNLLTANFLGKTAKASSATTADSANKVAKTLAIWTSTDKDSGSPAYSYDGSNAIEIDTIYQANRATNDENGLNIASNYAKTTDLSDYLPLSGGVVTGTIEKQYNSASTDPLLKIGSQNQDINIFKVYSSTHEYNDVGVYGYNLKYIGTGEGANNNLILYCDNQTATTQAVGWSLNQTGQMGIGTTPSTSYRLYVNGAVNATTLYESGTSLASKYQATINGGASTITSSNLTVSRALISNSSGKVAVSDVTATELGYLDGVTSNIQTQLNNKLTSDEEETITGIKTFVGQTILKASSALSSADNTKSGLQFLSNAGNQIGKITTNDSGGLGFYAKSALYFRPVIDSDGSVNTNYGVTMDSTGLYAGSTSMNLGTSSKYWGDAYLTNANITNTVSVNKLTITSTDMINHIEFSRNSWNYIVASGGSSAVFAFVAGGKSASGANTTLALYGDKAIPGQRDNKVDLGDSSYHFKNFYIKGKIYNGSYNYSFPTQTGTIALVSDLDWDKIANKPTIPNEYTLPLAQNGVLGGIQVGYTATSTSGTVYNAPVALSSEKAYVAITKTAITTALGYTPLQTATDTKNTAGSTNTESKIYLVGATTQAANPQTYSDAEVYAEGGEINATSVCVAEAVQMKYDSSSKCLRFIFE